MSGRITNPKWGAKHELLQFEIVDERTSLDEWLPPKVITKSYFPDAPDISLGFPMSTLYGHVKTVCPLIKTHTAVGEETWKTYLIAGHHCHPVTGGWLETIQDTWTTVWVDKQVVAQRSPVITDNVGRNGWWIVNGYTSDPVIGADKEHFNQPICYLGYRGTAPISEDSVVTIILPGKTNNHFVSNPGNKFSWDCVSMLYDLYINHTGFGPYKIDYRSFKGAFQAGLNKWRISSFFNGFGGDRMKAIDTIHKRILPQIPAFEYYIQGKLGLAFIDIWDNVAGHEMADVLTYPGTSMDFIHGYNILDRIGQVEEASIDEVKNDFTIKFGFNVDNAAGGWRNVLRFSSGEKLSREAGVNEVYHTVKYPRCVNSRAKFGYRPADTIYCHDLPFYEVAGAGVKIPRNSAYMLGEFLSYFYTFRPKYLTVVGNQSTLMVNPGQFIRYTEEEIDYSKKVCLVVGKEVGLDRSRFRLRTWENILGEG